MTLLARHRHAFDPLPITRGVMCPVRLGLCAALFLEGIAVLFLRLMMRSAGQFRESQHVF